jgi:hypothetical protein
MAKKPFSGPLVIGGDVKILHICFQGFPEPGAGLRLKKTVLYVGDGMGPGCIKADGGAGDGKLGLVPITLGIFGAIYNRNGELAASDPGKAVLDLLPLKLQFLLITHMA